MFKVLTLRYVIHVYILCHTPSRLWIVDIAFHVVQVIRNQRHQNSKIVDAVALCAVQMIENYFQWNHLVHNFHMPSVYLDVMVPNFGTFLDSTSLFCIFCLQNAKSIINFGEFLRTRLWMTTVWVN